MAEVTGKQVVELKDVSKVYEGPAGDIHALREVNLTVGEGEFIGVRGPSGSGKSTLLNMITGIDRPSDGQITIAGQDIVGLNENQLARWRGKQVGVIFQFFQLLPTLTVIENIMLPMEFARAWKAKERPKRAMELLEQVDLADQAFKLPNTLSGGQLQRAAIARSLANDPPLVVADEPTGNLDSKTADRVFALFEGLVDRGVTFMMVTHDNSLAERFPRLLHVADGYLSDKNNGHKA
ncbi:MAG: ABC transporter ATP-binding protein [Chloroflexi bacterium]|nr:MAG: ABC transporter ATP-binding protein [Chloroflexota bacterium]MBL1192984.1 ABC transporter ATP-binding protein [Chloroflexota bacterium]NOH10276.1 ABC transporter ATP-binding protein [Chloroflexota bacterium]